MVRVQLYQLFYFFRNYLTGFFIFDILSSIPRHLPYIIYPPPYPPIMLLGLMNIFRYFKIPRIVTLIQIIERVALVRANLLLHLN